jgi:hypothetical protein
MDGIRELLDTVRRYNLATQRLRGLFHVLIGRTIHRADGTLISQGITWRKLSVELKVARIDKDLVAELGVDPDTLSPRDRERFWYSAIGLARVDSQEARQQADVLAGLLLPLGFVVAPATTIPAAATTSTPVVPTAIPAPTKPRKRTP